MWQPMDLSTGATTRSSPYLASHVAGYGHPRSWTPSSSGTPGPPCSPGEPRSAHGHEPACVRSIRRRSQVHGPACPHRTRWPGEGAPMPEGRVCCLRSGENVNQFSWNRVIFACIPSPRHARPEPGDKQRRGPVVRDPAVLVPPFVLCLTERLRELGRMLVEIRRSLRRGFLLTGRPWSGLGSRRTNTCRWSILVSALAGRPRGRIVGATRTEVGGLSEAACASGRAMSDIRTDTTPVRVGSSRGDRRGPEWRTGLEEIISEQGKRQGSPFRSEQSPH